MKSRQALVLRSAEGASRRTVQQATPVSRVLERPSTRAAQPPPQDEVALSGRTQSRHAKDRGTHSAAFASGATPAACEWAMALATVAIAGMPPSCIDSTAVEGTMTIVALLRFKPS